MFTKDTLNEDERLRERWQRHCQERYGDIGLGATTESGIEVKPVYSPADIAHIDYRDIGLPGEYPFTRGHSPLRYQIQPWMMRIGYGYGAGADARERREFLARIGMSQGVGTDRPAPFTLLIDLPTQRGYDADEPAARGRVGCDGVSISTMRDLDLLFHGVPLDQVETIFISPDPSMAMLAHYIVYAERQGLPQQKLRLKACNLLYRQYFWDTISFPPQSATKLIVELIKYCTEYMPLVQCQSITGYNPGEAGANAFQEVAFTLAVAIAITEECIKVGLDPDDFVPRFYGHDHLSLDLWENVAKFRARRRLWAKIFKERFGCKKPESLCFKTWPQTAGSELTAQEPLNNIIRVTLMALAGVLAGVDGIWTASYDEALSIPSEEAAQIAVRTQQILYHETNIPHVSDPLGGSYYMEWLTSRIEEEATKLIGKIDELGGFVKCWEEGWFKQEIQRTANERRRRIDSGEKVVVGVNKYRLSEEGPEFRAFRNPEIEEEAIARVRKFRTERDNDKTGAALTKLEAAAQSLTHDWPGSCGCLMPEIIDSVRADATLGEIMRVLREVYGYGYAY